MKAYYLFGKTQIPPVLERELEAVLKKLEGIDDQETYLEAAYDTITRRYRGGRRETFTKVADLFSSSLQDLWNREGFLHCTNQNYLLALILVRSGRFREQDITPQWTLIWYCAPHQYLQVKLRDGRSIAVDPWARSYGVPFGRHAYAFNTTARRQDLPAD